ncbi:penicillin acylase family protein [Thalassomonas actiniarum]|uniref:Penicillin acylase family protein n=1 Tax=Thalassomonas actiniarum TaxID=485447 RepID=A0AAF0C6Q4_9GAMM|nr:penicillin acylase family protein [Thalassomonas actiniarum]WDE02355.1 penicillin acylase family protein [Thalassomonas actiniarum]
MLLRSHPILSRFLIWVVTPFILLLAYSYSFLLQSLPQKEGTVRLQGLDSAVKVIRDENAIPHILADNDLDAFFALGYVHAQDRLWQMNFSIRLATGRLSEILGRDSLNSDKFMRTLGIYRASEQALLSLDERSRRTLEAYAKGINAWIKEGHTLPLEFQILDAEPELWEPVNSIALIKLMAYNLGGLNSGRELTLSALIKELGVDNANELMPNVNAQSFPDTETAGLIDKDIILGLLAQNEQVQPQFNVGGEGLGSNAWVVSGEYTQSGLPLLASDPHLGVEIPAVWYLAEIQGDELHVTGATYPGAPIVLMGQNESIAWGTTNMLADAQDLYVVRTNDLNEDQYKVDGQWLDMEVEEELIHVKSDFPQFLTDPIPPVKWQVRSTRHGPLISDAIGRSERPLALRWSALDEQDKTFQSFLDINYADDWTSFKSAFEGYAAPALNFIYADNKGDIGLFAAGNIPIRHHSNGRIPVPGWNSKYEWDGYIPTDSLPHILNPEQGYIANANNKNHTADYPYLISNIWAAPFRVERINKTIESYIDKGKKITVQDFIDLQGDEGSLQVQQLLPFLLSLAPQSARQESVISKLKGWDGVLSGDSEEAVVYQVWLRHFNTLLLSDDMRGSALHEERANGLQGFLSVLKPTFINNAVNQSDSLQFDWCDQITTEKPETCEELALIALNGAIDEIDRQIGGNKKWGDVHETYYPHLVFTNSQLLSSIFDRGIEGSGDRYTVNSGNWRYTEDGEYRTGSSANYRQIVDLSDRTKGGFINNTGQSGNVISGHYDDNIKPFKQLKLWPMQLNTVHGAESASTLTLEPIK